jgi:ferredoxin
VFGVVLRPTPYWDYNNVYYQNLELPLMVVNVFLGNCSTYCEMGIDVRSYAEKEKTLFVPPVGCGICAAVCPRGVLKLENDTGRPNQFERNFTRK